MDFAQQNVQSQLRMASPSDSGAGSIMPGGILGAFGLKSPEGLAPIRIRNWSEEKVHLFGSPGKETIVDKFLKSLSEGPKNMMDGVGTADIYGHNLLAVGSTADMGSNITFDGSTTEISAPAATPGRSGGAMQIE